MPTPIHAYIAAISPDQSIFLNSVSLPTMCTRITTKNDETSDNSPSTRENLAELLPRVDTLVF